MMLNEFHSVPKATSFVCCTIQKVIHEDIHERSEASLILTGGTTTRPFLKALAAIDVPWEKVWVILSDERWVATTHADSNEKQLRELFLSRLKVQPRYISLKTGHVSPEEAVPYLEKAILPVPQPFSCGLLSVGEDGHVASLFPEEAEKWGEDRKYLFASPQRGNRLSLGLPFLGNVRCSIVLLKKDRSINENMQPLLVKIPNKYMVVLSGKGFGK